ncbi:hypothetical protein OKJ48_44020 [Streptomyces kunmingensis]|uniref:Uncharacterized protein n=1 Tax=Streptomyces kunmingensis TaxID=68225 RepID=A0ABU6CT46_9ACTN|nr:hypothetical protein [Streptomyces kunmingensis]MEB3967156.1 hypothetical protein [Streptomyces kunmingensis]
MDAPTVLKQHSLFTCPFADRAPAAQPGVWWTLLTGIACVLIVAAFLVTVQRPGEPSRQAGEQHGSRMKSRSGVTKA